jgi:hypothetical protein
MDQGAKYGKKVEPLWEDVRERSTPYKFGQFLYSHMMQLIPDAVHNFAHALKAGTGASLSPWGNGDQDQNSHQEQQGMASLFSKSKTTSSRGSLFSSRMGSAADKSDQSGAASLASLSSRRMTAAGAGADPKGVASLASVGTRGGRFNDRDLNSSPMGSRSQAGSRRCLSAACELLIAHT